MEIFLINQNNTPDFNFEDFIWGKWFSFKEIDLLISKNIAVKPDLPILINLLKKTLDLK